VAIAGREGVAIGDGGYGRRCGLVWPEEAARGESTRCRGHGWIDSLPNLPQADSAGGAILPPVRNGNGALIDGGLGNTPQKLEIRDSYYPNLNRQKRQKTLPKIAKAVGCF